MSAVNQSTASIRARDRHGDRGIPPPALIDLDKLPDSALLTEGEVAAVLRIARITIEAWRRRPGGGPLPWIALGPCGNIRYRAGALRKFIASGQKRTRPSKQKISTTPPIASDATKVTRRRRRRADDAAASNWEAAE